MRGVKQIQFNGQQCIKIHVHDGFMYEVTFLWGINALVEICPYFSAVSTVEICFVFFTQY